MGSGGTWLRDSGSVLLGRSIVAKGVVGALLDRVGIPGGWEVRCSTSR